MAEKTNVERHETCPMRHAENGNCLPHGGFCTSVAPLICEAMHHAYQDGVAAQKSRFYHIMLLEFTRSYLSVEEDCVAVFDDRKITSKEVKEYIKISDVRQDPRVAIMPKDVWLNVFGAAANKN